jgi:hypothetical protein
MKNLHLIPTDKPSTLFKDAFDKYFISINIDREQNHFKPQYIYITSDEEIKVGDWYCSPYGIISKHNGTEMLPDYWKKIILTTDQDLIADGIQTINEEFLEWFVKNPSCEDVETKLVRQRCHLTLNDWVDEDKNGKFPISIAGAFRYRKIYKIIIPQVEPKQIKCYCGHTITCDCEPLVEPKQEYYCKACGISQDEPFGKCHNTHKHCSCEIRLVEEPKQETLEEAAEKWNEKQTTLEFGKPHNSPNRIKSFIDGAKWQEKRSYSEEDMKLAFEAGHKKGFSGYPNTENWKELPFKEWFEQFKNK